MILEVENLTKNYGDQCVVNGLSFSLKKGEITGLLGINGAGKSTTMKMLTGSLLPSGGSIKIMGEIWQEDSVRQRGLVGYLPEHNPLYDSMYVREYLCYSADFYGVAYNDVEEAIYRLGLDAVAHKKIGALSKGYRQRVGLAAAILHQPRILILDEPTTGLDPNQIIEIRQIIRELSRDRAVLLSSHIMQEIQSLCDNVIILHRGKLVWNSDLSHIRKEEQIIEVAFDYRVEERLLRSIPGVISVENKTDFLYEIKFDNTQDGRSLLFDFALENDLKIWQINYKYHDLERLFHKLTKE